MAVLFRKTKALESQIDDYLDIVDRAAMLFLQGIKLYFEKRYDEFELRYLDLRAMESRGDALRRDIENKILAIHSYRNPERMYSS